MKKTLLVILVVLIGIQFIRIDKTNPSINPKEDYVNIAHAPENVQTILKRSCYDCHSNEVVYPWYTNISPISWYIKDHINEGREHVNFSEFGKYNMLQIQYANTALYKAVKGVGMPLDSYTLVHKNAVLSSQDRKILLDWFKQFALDDGTE
ncbi:MAG: heme-binding domain-containing protein [Flavobacteriaceae bacterium]|jgi:hypothetical protein|nr:heme-binding domain-containing protein [Flavobacteriaceae bacterium]